MGRTLGSKNRKSYEFGPVDNMAVQLSPEESVKTMVVTESPKDVTAGRIVETFSIKVKDDEDKVIYQEDNQPFEWNKVDSIFGVITAEGGNLTEEQIAFMTEALSDSDKEKNPNGKAVRAVVDMYNSVTRANAKQNEYARVMNLKKPLIGEKLESAVENMVTTFARINKVSLETARETLKKAGVIQ